MAGVVVNLLEVNRVRQVNLEGITAALAEAVAAGEGREPGEQLEPVRELVRALRSLAAQPLPEALLSEVAEVSVELEAPRHELERWASQLEQLAAHAEAGQRRRLEELADELRARARA